MASLLDIFGGDDEALRGLLGSQYQPTREQAQAQALFGLAKGLYAAGAPSRTPSAGIGQGIAQGIEAGQQAYRQALQTSLADKLQASKVQEMLKNQQAESLLGRSFYAPEKVTPAMRPTPQQIEGGIVPQPTVTRGAPQFDVSKYIQGAVQLGINPKTIMENVKAMQGETLKLGEGESLYRTNPITGQLESIAKGGMKADSAIRQAMTILGIQTPVEQLSPAERQQISSYIDRQELLKSPKVAVDLKDPTAVTKAQMDIVKDFRGTVKESGDLEVANRYGALQDAVKQAKAGNPQAHGAIIYNIGKIYDPSGAVQEGDKATILGNRSIPEYVKGLAGKVFSGETLTNKEIDNLSLVATGLAKQRSNNIQNSVNTYKAFAQELGGSGQQIKNPYADILKEQPVVRQDIGLDMNALIAERNRRQGK